MLLLALLIIMVLAAVVLKQYMLSPGTTPRVGAGEAGAAPEGEAGGTQSALEGARDLQETVRRQAAEMQKRIDSADQ
jgi:hypothetical protein